MRIGSEWWRAIAGAIVGFGYGSILAHLSLSAAGGGHGIFLPLILSSAPLIVLGFFGFDGALFTAPVVWAAFGMLVAWSGREKWRRLTRVLLLLQYASGLAFLAVRGLDNLERLERVPPEFIVLWATVYLIGQAALWWRTSS